MITSPSAAPENTTAVAMILAVQVWDSNCGLRLFHTDPCPDPQLQPDTDNVYHPSSWRSGFSGRVVVSNPQATNRYLQIDIRYSWLPSSDFSGGNRAEFSLSNATSELTQSFGCSGGTTAKGCSDFLPREGTLHIRVFETLNPIEASTGDGALGPPQLVDVHYVFDNP
jgi:hypothetical protein